MKQTTQRGRRYLVVALWATMFVIAGSAGSMDTVGSLGFDTMEQLDQLLGGL